MFDLDPEKILLLGIVALVVLGPNRLPEAARSLGRTVAHLRRLSASLQNEVRDAIGEPGEELTSAVQALRVTDVRGNVRRAVTSTIIGSPAAPPTPAPGGAVPNVAAGSSGSSAPGPGFSAPDDPSLN